MNTAIILAAGRGTRMQAGMNKQYLLLKGKPILAYTLEAFERNSLIDDIILVIHKDDKNICKENIIDKYRFRKVSQLIDGGKERQESVYNGLLNINICDGSDIVIIHDGARPLITQEVINRCINGAKDHGASSAGVPIKETIKIIKGDKFVNYTPNRESVWITQTPQAFKFNLIKQAHVFAIDKQIQGTDDAMLVENIGKDIKMIEGDYENIKITTPDDLLMAEAILKYKKK